jgi:hypothetical protein
MLHKDYHRKGSVEKKKSLVVGLKTASRKVTLTLRAEFSVESL